MSCDLNTLKESATCFMSKCMGAPTRESIDLYIMLAFLAAKGGTDYTDNLSVLEADSKQWERLAKSDRDAINTYVSLQFAIANDADFPGGTSVENLKVLSKCIQCLGSEQRKSMMALVWCQIVAVMTQPDQIVVGGEGDGNIIIGGEGGDIEIGGEGG